MDGGDRVRLCGVCRLKVYNLSDMSPDEAAALVTEKEGRLCVRYYARPDGTMIVEDCPVGLAAIRRRMTRWFGGIAAVLVAAIGLGIAAASYSIGLRPKVNRAQPFAKLVDWLSGPPQRTQMVPQRPRYIIGSLMGARSPRFLNSPVSGALHQRNTGDPLCEFDDLFSVTTNNAPDDDPNGDGRDFEE
jgi:hypothetical protein